MGVKATVLERLRHGQREVAWTPDFMRLGNLLYMWLWAYEAQVDGKDRRCLATENTMPWLDVFPEARRFVLLRDEVRLRDQRVQPWRGAVPPEQRYDPPHLDAFCRTFLLPGIGAEPGPEERLVINVRRGDYYSSPENQRVWGFDIATFVRAAVSASVTDRGIPSSIHLVSDDTGWCGEELGFLRDVAPVTFGASSDPLGDLREVAQARRVILANSTFSYWAGYVGDVIGGPRHVLAPTFFHSDEPRSVRHLRPHWTAVDLEGR